MEFFQENIKLGEVVVQLIAFIIVFWTLKLKAWKPLLDSLQARQDKIQAEFDKIEKAAGDVELLKKEYALKLQKIEDEARDKIQEAVEESRRISKEIQDKAREEAQASFEKSKEHFLMVLFVAFCIMCISFCIQIFTSNKIRHYFILLLTLSNDISAY